MTRGRAKEPSESVIFFRYRRFRRKLGAELSEYDRRVDGVQWRRGISREEHARLYREAFEPFRARMEAEKLDVDRLAWSWADDWYQHMKSPGF